MPGPLPTNDLLRSLRAGDEKALESLYNLYREAFFHWAGQRFHCSRPALEDAWQDTVIVFYDRVRSGRLHTLDCSVKTYLFAVGFRVLSASERKMKPFSQRDEIDEALQAQIIVFDGDDPWLEARETLLAAMDDLSPPCRQLLRSRYFDEKSLLEIQQEFSYNSLNTVHASLSRCLKKLKDIIAGKMKDTPYDRP